MVKTVTDRIKKEMVPTQKELRDALNTPYPEQEALVLKDHGEEPNEEPLWTIPEHYYFWDLQTRQLVGLYMDPEDAVRDLGALQSYLGRDQTRRRYDLTRAPDANGMAQPVFPRDEFWGRALVYYDNDVYNHVRGQ